MSVESASVAETKALLQRAYVQLRALREERDANIRRIREPIAVIGMACRFPGGATSVEAYWELLRNGRDAIVGTPPDRGKRAGFCASEVGTNCDHRRHGGFLDDVAGFDPLFFGISPREAALIDPQQRLLLEVCWEALENASIPPEKSRGSATGLFVGMSTDDYSRKTLMSGEMARIDGSVALGCSRSLAPGRVAYCLGLQGPVLQLDTSCSSSLVAVHLACQSLRNAECDVALAGGVNLMLTPENTIALRRMNVLAPDGKCKTFDASANGYVRSEGAGIVVLKRLSAAQADGDRIFASITGSAINHDGQSNGLTAPNGEAQQRVVECALQNAGCTYEDIQFIEAHGTGTNLGDPIEVMALARVFERATKEVYLGSVKANLGHLEAAAGIASLIKTVLSIEHAEIPPNIHLSHPNPRVPWDSIPFRVPTKPVRWPDVGKPRAGVSSFGMSGTNVHLILEAKPAEDRMPAGAGGELQLLCISAKTPAALHELALRYAERLESASIEDFADICFSAAVGRGHWPERLAVVAATPQEMAQSLRTGQTSKETLEHSVAQWYMRGAEIDWRQLYQGQQHRRIAIPNYPFQRQRYWADFSEAKGAAGESTQHPLLGSRLDVAPILYEYRVTAQSPAFLHQHSLQEIQVLPAAAYVELALEALRSESGADLLELHSVRFENPLRLEAGREIRIQVGLELTEGKRYRFEISSSTEKNSWIRNATGEAGIAPAAPEFTQETHVLPSNRLDIDVDEFYSALEKRGIGIGPDLRGVCSLSHRENEAWGEILTSGAGAQYVMDPRLLDGALQVAFALQPDAAALVLSGFDRFSYFAPVGQWALSHASMNPTGLIDIHLYDRAGSLAARFESLRTVRPSVETPELIHEVTWEPQDRMPVPDQELINLGRYDEFLEEAENLSGLYAAHAGRVQPKPTPAHEDLFRRVLEIAREAGGQPVPLAEINARVDAAARRFPECIPELNLLQRCGAKLPEVLAGLQDPLELLFPGGNFDDATSVFRDSPGGRFLNDQLVKTLTEAIKNRASVRVLEVGAGTGGSTAALLRAVAEKCETYVFSDVSRLFLERARAKFASYPFFRTAILDAERPASTPAFSSERFDVIVAANVLHATSDLAATLRHLKQLLALGGRLILAEGIAPRRWLDLTFGLTEGWWRFTDRDFRANYPLIPAAKWETLLQSVGFESIEILESPGSQLRQAVLTARLDEPISQTRWLFIDNDGGIARKTAQQLGDVTIAQAAGSDWTQHDAVVYLKGLDIAAPATAGETSYALCHDLLEVVQKLILRPPSHGLWIVTRGVGAGTVNVGASALWGLARSIQSEHPELGCRLIDIDPDQDTSEQLLTILRRGAVAGCVDVWRGSSLLSTGLKSRRARKPVSFKARDDGSYVITGGIGGMGLRFAAWLRDRGARHLVLISRSAPSETANEALNELRSSGADVLTIQADVSDRPRLSEALDLVRRTMPPIRGVIHAAGVFADSLVREHEWRLFEAVFAPKVRGSWNLHELTTEDSLDFFVLCSSVVSLVEAPGLANYAAANSFLDALARYRRGLGLTALSVNWGPWQNTGMAAAVGEKRRAQWSAHGIGMIGPGEATFCLEELLAENAVQAAVFRREPAVVLAKDSLPVKLDKAPRIERGRITLEHVREVIGRRLGFDPSLSVPTKTGLFQLGLDSLVSLEVLKELEATTQRRLPNTLFFSHPNVEAVSLYIAELMQAPEEEAIEEVAVMPVPGRDDNGDERSECKPDRARLSNNGTEESLLGEVARLEALIHKVGR